ncbi:MAG: group II truncated hemoglobin [bacterium]|nr:group II truncated hemoglobin [bacterium]
MTEPEIDPYSELGGADGVRLLVDHFYAAMDRLPEAQGIRAMHAPDLGPMRELLFDFLSGWLGGPPLYLERTDRKCMRSAHEPFTIGPAERDAWLACMDVAMEEVEVDAELQLILHQAFRRVTDSL